MTIKTWQERLDETTQGVDWITAHTIQIKFMKAEIDELRDTLQVKSGMWCGIEKKWQEKYEALLRGTPASAWISVDERLPDINLYDSDIFIVQCKRVHTVKPYVFQAFYVNDPDIKSPWFENTDFYNDNEIVEIDGDKVTHWQPMPAPSGEQK